MRIMFGFVYRLKFNMVGELKSLFRKQFGERGVNGKLEIFGK